MHSSSSSGSKEEGTADAGVADEERKMEVNVAFAAPPKLGAGAAGAGRNEEVVDLFDFEADCGVAGAT